VHNDIHGKLIEGTAEGFLARIIQHEIDHLNGTLYIDLIKDASKILPIEEYRERRKRAMEAQTQE
jgi:peptide deformylase